MGTGSLFWMWAASDCGWMLATEIAVQPCRDWESSKEDCLLAPGLAVGSGLNDLAGAQAGSLALRSTGRLQRMRLRQQAVHFGPAVGQAVDLVLPWARG